MAILHAKQVIQRFRYSEIQYRLLTFESRMSSGDNGWVVYFPAIIKEAVMISSPGDFCYSRNNPDTIRHRISGVHIFLLLTYS